MGNQFLWLSGNRLATQQLGTTDRGQMQIGLVRVLSCFDTLPIQQEGRHTRAHPLRRTSTFGRMVRAEFITVDDLQLKIDTTGYSEMTASRLRLKIAKRRKKNQENSAHFREKRLLPTRPSRKHWFDSALAGWLTMGPGRCRMTLAMTSCIELLASLEAAHYKQLVRAGLMWEETSLWHTCVVETNRREIW